MTLVTLGGCSDQWTHSWFHTCCRSGSLSSGCRTGRHPGPSLPSCADHPQQVDALYRQGLYKPAAPSTARMASRAIINGRRTYLGWEAGGTAGLVVDREWRGDGDGDRSVEAAESGSFCVYRQMWFRNIKQHNRFLWPWSHSLLYPPEKLFFSAHWPWIDKKQQSNIINNHTSYCCITITKHFRL